MIALITVVNWYINKDMLNYEDIHKSLYDSNGYNTEKLRTLYHNNDYSFFVISINNLVPMKIDTLKNKILSRLEVAKRNYDREGEIGFLISFLESDDKVIL